MSYEENRPKTDKVLRRGGGRLSRQDQAAIEAESKITFNIVQQRRELARGENARPHVVRFLHHRNEVHCKKVIASGGRFTGVARAALELSMKDREREGDN